MVETTRVDLILLDLVGCILSPYILLSYESNMVKSLYSKRTLFRLSIQMRKKINPHQRIESGKMIKFKSNRREQHYTTRVVTHIIPKECECRDNKASDISTDIQIEGHTTSFF